MARELSQVAVIVYSHKYTKLWAGKGVRGQRHKKYKSLLKSCHYRLDHHDDDQDQHDDQDQCDDDHGYDTAECELGAEYTDINRNCHWQRPFLARSP